MNRKHTVLVTGGTRGIGKAMVFEFAASGYNIAFAYKNSDKAANQIISQLQDKGINCLSCKCDVSDMAQVKSMYNTLKAHFGFIDTVINNAGVSKSALFTDEDETGFDYIVGNNLKSVFNVCSTFAPDMISESYGRIINISSIWGISGASCEVLYSASKAGVIGFSKALAKELAPSNIMVNVIAPGMIDTEMNNNLSNKEKAEFLKNVPLGIIGQPLSVAKTAVFLAEADYITGEVIKVSGGI